MKKENNSQKKLKEIFNKSTKKGQKAILILTLGIGLSGGYIIGHYGDTRVTGDVVTYDNGKIKQSELYNNLKNNVQSSNMIKTNIALATFGNTYGKGVKDSDVTQAIDFYEKSGVSQLSDKKDKKEITKQQLAFEKGLKSEMPVSDKDLKEAQAYYKAPIEFKFYVLDNETTAKAVASSLKSNNEVNSGLKKQIVAGGDETVKYTNSVEYSYQDLSSMFPQEVIEKLYTMKQSDPQVLKHEVINNSGQKKAYYYVLNLIKAENKSDDWKKNKKELTNLVKTKKAQTDAKAVNRAIKKVFKANHVKVKDDYLNKALSDYIK